MYLSPGLDLRVCAALKSITIRPRIDNYLPWCGKLGMDRLALATAIFTFVGVIKGGVGSQNFFERFSVCDGRKTDASFFRKGETRSRAAPFTGA
jgi:hypothetical protein